MVLTSLLPSETRAWNIKQKERFLERASGCIGVHLQGDELIRLEMHFYSNQRVFTATLRTGFVGSTASLTKEKTRCVGGVNRESLCALILVENPLCEYTERERSRMRARAWLLAMAA